MTIISSSVAAMLLLGKYKCPHCGVVQERMKTSAGSSLACTNCLKEFSPDKCAVEKAGTRKKRYR